MIKVLMICHGNICRSPIAEFILKTKFNVTYKDIEKGCDAFLDYLRDNRLIEEA